MQKYFLFLPPPPILSPRCLEPPGPGEATCMARAGAQCMVHGAAATIQPLARGFGDPGSCFGVGGVASGTPHPCHMRIPAPSILGTGEAAGCPCLRCSHTGKRGGSWEGF